MRYLAALVLFFTFAAYGAAVIFQGDYVKTLKDDLKLNDTARIVTGTADPSSSATDGEPGSIYIRNNGGAGTVYFKTDTGSSTNWSLLPSATVVTEIDGNVDDLITLSGEAENSTAHSAFTGTVLSGVTTTRSGLQALGTQVDTNTGHATGDGSDHQDVADLVTLSGVAANSTTLGTFTGSLIRDSLTVKGALQEVETYAEKTVYKDATNNSILIYGQEPPSLSTTGTLNVVLNPSAGSSNLSTGDGNVLLGHLAGATFSSQSFNTALGYQAMSDASGTSNVAVGYNSAAASSSGSNNSTMGYQAAQKNTGSGYVALGYQAARYNTSAADGSNGVYVGYRSGAEAKGTGNIMLGADVGYYGGSATTVSNRLLLDNNDCDSQEANASNTPCLIEGSMSGTNDQVTIHGELNVGDNNDLRLSETIANGSDYIGFKAPASVTTATTFTLPDGDGTSGYQLTTNGSGTLSWAAPGGDTFLDNVFRIQDNSDATKQLAFEVSGITTATTRTITVPDADIDLSFIADTILTDTGTANVSDGSGSGAYLSVTTSVTVTPGLWELDGACTLSAATSGINLVILAFYEADGADNTTAPTAFGASGNYTVSYQQNYIVLETSGSTIWEEHLSHTKAVINVTASDEIFVVPRYYYTSASGSVTCRVLAKRLR